LAAAALAVEKFEAAAAAAADLIRMSPTNVEHYFTRALAHAGSGDWERAEADCRAALAIHPLHPQVRALLGICRHRRGDAAGGRKEAETAAGLATTPRQRAVLLEWFERKTR